MLKSGVEVEPEGGVDDLGAFDNCTMKVSIRVEHPNEPFGPEIGEVQQMARHRGTEG